jgi:hypothetical protein
MESSPNAKSLQKQNSTEFQAERAGHERSLEHFRQEELSTLRDIHGNQEDPQVESSQKFKF